MMPIISNKELWPKITGTVKKRIPIVTWLPHYSFSFFLQDFLAGLTVGMTEIPQAIAYATIAGLPPEYGLYSGLVDGFLYTIFGGCKDVNVGPSSLLCLLLFPSVFKAGPIAAVLMTFLSGLIIMILGVMQLGFIINFVSFPVISGYIYSGVIQISLSQVVKLFGISGPTNSFIATCKTLFNRLHEIRIWDAVLGIGSLVYLLIFRKIGLLESLQPRQDWSKRRRFIARIIFIIALARSIIVLIIGTTLAYYLNEYQPFLVTGQISTGLPRFQTPYFSTTFNGTAFDFFDLISVFTVSLIFIPLSSILETFTVIKVFNKGKKVDATQELIAVGLCNIVGSFVGSMPVTGSFSRSTINNASGVRTTMGGTFTSILLLLVIAFLTSTFYYVPKTTLAAILLGAIIFLIDTNVPFLLWKNKLDIIPFLVTLISGLLLSVDYGILIGSIVNLLFILYPNARPEFNVSSEISSDFQNDVYVITPRDTLFFPAAEFLRDTVLKCKKDIIVINGKYIRSMDITVAKSIAMLVQDITIKNQKICLVSFKESVKKVCTGVDKKLEEYFVDEEQYKNMMAKDQSESEHMSVTTQNSIGESKK